MPLPRMSLGDSGKNLTYAGPHNPHQRIRITTGLMRVLLREQLLYLCTTFEDIVELSAMVAVGLAERSIDASHRDKFTWELKIMYGDSRVCEQQKSHTNDYIVILDRIFQYVYSTGIENWEKWNVLACTVDAKQDVLLEEEYKYLVGMIQRHGAEIHNADARVPVPNIYAKNCVTYESMRQELREKYQSSCFAQSKEYQDAVRASAEFRIDAGYSAHCLVYSEVLQLKREFNLNGVM